MKDIAKNVAKGFSKNRLLLSNHYNRWVESQEFKRIFTDLDYVFQPFNFCHKSSSSLIL